MTPGFSSRTGWNLEESGLSAEVRSAKEQGRPLIDLTLSNPTACGFDFDADAILSPLQNRAALTYDPDPRGIPSARAAVARYYADHGSKVDPAHILLTTSTSEAYSFLFRLLADPGDHVLVAQPSYPLFDFLAALDDVELRPYPLFYDFGWWIDLAELERRITSRTRAILLVHPNNPTGHATAPAERVQLEAICERHALALIVDEVFLDYVLTDPIRSFSTGPHRCLTFVLSGISKIAALPQMKVGWLAAFGPEALRTQALARLEVIADTFLSMNAPAQHALGAWLAGRQAIQQQLLQRIHANLAALAAAAHLSWLPVQAGWSAVLQLPQHAASESTSGSQAKSLAETLVQEAGLVVHPASFYAMAGAHRVVVSLIVPEAVFSAGIRKLTEWCISRGLTAAGGS